MKEIIIELGSDGEVRLVTRGFTGKACLEETQFIKDLLGKETARQLTPTYYSQTDKTVRRYLPLCG